MFEQQVVRCIHTAQRRDDIRAGIDRAAAVMSDSGSRLIPLVLRTWSRAGIETASVRPVTAPEPGPVRQPSLRLR